MIEIKPSDQLGLAKYKRIPQYSPSQAPPLVGGVVDTEMTVPLEKDPVRSSRIMARIPMGRWGMPEELQGIAVFLASDASAYMTGQTVYVDGGWLAG